MTEYLKNLIPRLQEFSSKLDKKEVFIDKPWIYFDEENNQHTYIFKRDGRLIMSLNGDVQTGKWEFLPEAQSLHIDRIKNQILLNQALVFDGLMLLRKDGSKSEPWVLINKQVVPDLDYGSYLKELIVKKLQLKAFKLNDGKKYYYSEYTNYGSGLDKGCKVYDENFNPLTGTRKIGYGEDKTLIITDGFLTGIICQREYQTSRGVLTIFQQNLHEISLGDTASVKNVEADGFYQFTGDEDITSVDIGNGKVTSITQKGVFNDVKKWHIVLTVGILAFIICLIWVSTYYSNKKQNNETVATEHFGLQMSLWE